MLQSLPGELHGCLFFLILMGKTCHLCLTVYLSHSVLRAVGTCCFAIPVPRCHPTSTDGLQLQTQSCHSVPSLVPQQSSHPSVDIWHRRSTILAAGDQAGLAGVVPVTLCPQMCDTQLCCALGTAHRWDLVTCGQSLVCRTLVSSRKGFRAQLCSPLLKVAPFSFPLQPTTLPQGTINMNQCTDVVDGESRTGQKFSLCILTPEKEHFIRAENKEIISG